LEDGVALDHPARFLREFVEQVDLPLLWLSGLSAPDHNSLWRFWRDNQEALRAIFKQTVHLAAKTGAVGFALQALDGTKIQAARSGPKGWSKKYLEKLPAQLAAAREDLQLKVIEENPQTETGVGCSPPSQKRLRDSLGETSANTIASPFRYSDRVKFAPLTFQSISFETVSAAPPRTT
jgi:hypothetical protein